MEASKNHNPHLGGVWSGGSVNVLFQQHHNARIYPGDWEESSLFEYHKNHTATVIDFIDFHLSWGLEIRQSIYF